MARVFCGDDSPLRVLPLLCVAVCLLGASLSASAEPIISATMKVEFSREATTKRWSRQIESTAGKPAYFLKLRPEYAVGHYLIGISLVLQDARRIEGDSNLLRPSGDWHGLQPYNFMAEDLSHGPQHSAFGSHRTIINRERGIIVQIDILDARTSIRHDKNSAIPPDFPQLDELSLTVSVDNLRDEH